MLSTKLSQGTLASYGHKQQGSKGPGKNGPRRAFQDGSVAMLVQGLAHAGLAHAVNRRTMGEPRSASSGTWIWTKRWNTEWYENSNGRKFRRTLCSLAWDVTTGIVTEKWEWRLADDEGQLKRKRTTEEKHHEAAAAAQLLPAKDQAAMEAADAQNPIQEAMEPLPSAAMQPPPSAADGGTGETAAKAQNPIQEAMEPPPNAG